MMMEVLSRRAARRLALQENLEETLITPDINEGKSKGDHAAPEPGEEQFTPEALADVRSMWVAAETPEAIAALRALIPPEILQRAIQAENF
jgi:hypothetical protein